MFVDDFRSFVNCIEVMAYMVNHIPQYCVAIITVHALAAIPVYLTFLCAEIGSIREWLSHGNGHWRPGVTKIWETTFVDVYDALQFVLADQRKHQSSASLAFVWGHHRWSVNSPPKGLITRKMFPFDVVIMGPGVEATKAPFVHFSVKGVFVFAKNAGYVLYVAIAELGWAVFYNKRLQILPPSQYRSMIENANKCICFFIIKNNTTNRVNAEQINQADTMPYLIHWYNNDT